jgi:phage-related minor tail protein
MADEIAQLMVKIGGDTGDLKKALDDAQGSIKSFGSGITSVGMALTAGITVPLVALGAAALKASADVNGALRQIQRETGLTGEGLDNAKQQFKDLFSTVPASAGEVATALSRVIQQLDVSSTAAEGLAKQFLNLSRMTGTDLTTNIDGVTQSFNAWSLSAADMKTDLDALYTISQNTGQGVSDISDITARAAGPAQAMGLSYQETAILVAQLGQAGVPTKQIVSSLNAVIKDATKDNVSAGVEWQNLINKFKDPSYKATADDMAILGNNTTNFAAAARRGDLDYGPLLQKIKDSPNAINDMANKTTTLSEALQLMRNRLELALTPLGTAIGTAARGAVDSMDPLMKIVESLGVAFSALPAPVQQAIVIFGALASAVGPALISFGSFASAMTQMGAILLGPIIAGLSGAAPLFIALAVGIAAVVAIVGPLVAGFAIAYTMSNTLRGVIGTLGAAFKDFGGHLLTAVNLMIGGKFQEGLKEITKGFTDLLTALKTIDWKSVGDKIITEIKDQFTNKKSAFNAIAQDLANWFKSINWSDVGKTIGDLLVQGIKTFFQTNTLVGDELFKSSADNTGWDNLKTAAKNAWEAFKKAFTDALGAYYDSGQFNTDLTNAIKAVTIPVLEITAAVILTITDITLKMSHDALKNATANFTKDLFGGDWLGAAGNLVIMVALHLSGLEYLEGIKEIIEAAKWIWDHRNVNIGFNITIGGMFTELIYTLVPPLRWIVENFSVKEVGFNITLGGLWETLVNIVYPALQWFVQHLSTICTLTMNVVDNGIAAAKSLWDSFVDKVVTLTQNVVQTAASQVNPANANPNFNPNPVNAPAATPGSSSPETYNPQGFQHGGIVLAPTLGVVAEAGPEAVFPLKILTDSFGDMITWLSKLPSLLNGINSVLDDVKKLLVTSNMQRVAANTSLSNTVNNTSTLPITNTNTGISAANTGAIANSSAAAANCSCSGGAGSTYGGSAGGTGSCANGQCGGVGSSGGGYTSASGGSSCANGQCGGTNYVGAAQGAASAASPATVSAAPVSTATIKAGGKVIVHVDPGIPDCPHCKDAEQYLRDNKIPYEVVSDIHGTGAPVLTVVDGSGTTIYQQPGFDPNDVSHLVNAANAAVQGRAVTTPASTTPTITPSAAPSLTVSNMCLPGQPCSLGSEFKGSASTFTPAAASKEIFNANAGIYDFIRNNNAYQPLNEDALGTMLYNFRAANSGMPEEYIASGQKALIDNYNQHMPAEIRAKGLTNPMVITALAPSSPTIQKAVYNAKVAAMGPGAMSSIITGIPDSEAPARAVALQDLLNAPPSKGFSGAQDAATIKGLTTAIQPAVGGIERLFDVMHPELQGISKDAAGMLKSAGQLNTTFKADMVYTKESLAFMDQLGVHWETLVQDGKALNVLMDDFGNIIVRAGESVNATIVAERVQLATAQRNIDTINAQNAATAAAIAAGTPSEYQATGSGSVVPGASQSDLMAAYVAGTPYAAPSEYQQTGSGSVVPGASQSDLMAAYLAGTPYHRGGLAGIQYFHAGAGGAYANAGNWLGNDEILSVLQKGERIFSVADTSALDNIINSQSATINQTGGGSQRIIQTSGSGGDRDWDKWATDFSKSLHDELDALFKDIFGDKHKKTEDEHSLGWITPPDNKPINVPSPTKPQPIIINVGDKTLANIMVKTLRKSAFLEGDYYY